MKLKKLKIDPLLRELREKGIKIKAIKRHSLIVEPASKLTPELRKKIKENRDLLLDNLPYE